MSNQVTPLPKMATAFAQLKLDPNKRMSGGIVGGFTSIGYKGKIWSLRYQGDTHYFTREDDGTPVSYLDVVIVGFNPVKSRAYYPGKWDEDSAGAPVCTAAAGIRPDPGVPEPQSKACANCKQSEWVTQANGKTKPACQEHKRLAILLMPRVTAHLLGSPLEEPIHLKIPPASLTQFKNYDDLLRHQGFIPQAVVTRIQFDPQHTFRFNFSIAKVLTEREAPWVVDKILNHNSQILRITGEQLDIEEIREVREVREVRQAPVQEEPAEAELIDDFQQVSGEPVAPAVPAAPATAAGRRSPGRPRKVVEQAAKADEEDDMFAVPASNSKEATKGATKPAAPAQAATPAGNGPMKWREASNAIDRSVDDMLNQRIKELK